MLHEASPRDREIQHVIEILSHRERANSVMLLGEAGVGKTAIVEGLARRLEYEPETVPVRLRDCQVSDVFRLAFSMGCKGITVYRHGARAGQVLTQMSMPGLCPDCRSALDFSEGTSLCRACGFSPACS